MAGKSSLFGYRCRKTSRKGELPKGMKLVNPVEISVGDIKDFIDTVIEKNDLSDYQVRVLEKVKRRLVC